MTEATEQKDVMQRKLSGIVVSAKSDKTVVVQVERKLRHELYGKLFTRSKKFHVHDEKNQYKEGDAVEFVACRPMSKKKRFRVVYTENSNEQ